MSAAEKQERSGPIVVLGQVEKNKREQLRVAIDQYQGHVYVELRVMVPNAAGEFIPIAKGVAIPLRRLPAVIDFLRAALDEAKRRNLFSQGDH